MTKIYVKEVTSCDECPHKQIQSYNTYKCRIGTDRKLLPKNTGVIPKWCSLEEVNNENNTSNR